MMEYSHDTAATNVGKLQVSVIQADISDELGLYPMVDGIYVTTDSRTNVFTFLDGLFNRFSAVLINRHSQDSKPHIKFSPIIRAGIAKGDVCHWEDLNKTDLKSHEHKNALLSGEAVALANKSEENAPPFGIRVHGSATSGFTRTLKNREWWKNDNQKSLFKTALNEYFDYYEGRPHPRYPDEKISQHREEANEYLG